ncbi:hypothetical protein M8J77_000931 [Diaphorina citri]|nr:hypothetical protein M8J77_000931 [Diaphorina citri]
MEEKDLKEEERKDLKENAEEGGGETRNKGRNGEEENAPKYEAVHGASLEPTTGGGATVKVGGAKGH